METKILRIDAKTTFALRHPLLRKGRPLSDCPFENDTHPESLHLGADDQVRLVGILSALPNPYPKAHEPLSYQLGGIAVLPSYERKGIASQLIQKAIAILSNEHRLEILWLNARIQAQNLYLNNGFKAIGATFEIAGIGTHQRFFKKFNP